jgi:hypothetical protein
VPRHPICEAIQPQEQTYSQVEGVQPVEAPSNEPQQPITIKIPFH